jgi:DNA-binding transcriptional MerR regulator
MGSPGPGGSVCSTHSGLGKRAAMQVTDADRREDSIVGDTPRQEEFDLSSSAGSAGSTGSSGSSESGITVSSAPVQGGLFPDDSVPDELVGYRGPSACQIAGITYRQLDYWARTSLVVPSIRSAAGSGSQRLYSFKDILVLKIVKRLLDTGISLHNIRVAVDHLRQRGVRDLANITLFSDGTTVYECTSAEEVVDLLQGGQGVFGIAVSGAMRELTGAIADFPGERADGGESIAAPEDELASRRKHRDRKIG